MESTGTNGEEPRIIREKCPLILLEHLKSCKYRDLPLGTI